MKSANLILITLISLTFVSCAGTSYKQYAQDLGYTQEEANKIEKTYMKYAKYYVKNNAQTGASFLGLNPSRNIAEAKLQNIYCKCVATIDNKCDGRLSKVSPKNQSTWIKGNASKMVLNAVSGTSADIILGASTTQADSDFCI